MNSKDDTHAQWRRALVALAIAATLWSCATRAPDPPPRPDARATMNWGCCWFRAESIDDPEAIWTCSLHADLPDDDLECNVGFRSGPKLVEGSWIEEGASVRVTRSGGLEGEGHPIRFFSDPPAPKLVTPRPYYLIDNPGMRFRWIDPSTLPPTEPPPPPPPRPPNCAVPRAVVDRLVTLRDTSEGREVPLDPDDVVMKWALACLRSELAKSEAQ